MRHAYGHAPLVARTPAVDGTTLLHSEQLIHSFAHPPGKVILLYGDDLVFPLALRMAAQAMTNGAPIAVVDGANRFNVHLLSRFARERRLNADEFLQRIFISRGFTCYQMEQAVIHRLPAFLERVGGQTALIFGLLDTFYDEQAPLREVQQMLQRVLAALHGMKAGGASLLLVCSDWRVVDKERSALFETLKRGMDRVVKQETRSTEGMRLEEGTQNTRALST